MSNKKSNQKSEIKPVTTDKPSRVLLSPELFNVIVTTEKRSLRRELGVMYANGTVDFTKVDVAKLLEQVGKTRQRVAMPDGFSKTTHKVCTQCYKNALEAGKLPEAAAIDAALPLASFGTVKGKINPYCKACSNKKAVEYSTKRRLQNQTPEEAKAEIDRLTEKLNKLKSVAKTSETASV